MKIGDKVEVYDNDEDEIDVGFITQVIPNRLTAGHVVMVTLKNGWNIRFDFDVSGKASTNDVRYRFINKQPENDSELKVIRATDLHPDDIIVVRPAEKPSDKIQSQIRKGLQEMFPNNKVIILSPGDELEIISPKEEAAGPVKDLTEEKWFVLICPKCNCSDCYPPGHKFYSCTSCKEIISPKELSDES